ncbi:MAG: 6-carboxytetrahydropterin synthase [Bacteroidota bacterium]|nr:6-carboxytetrahydropterin synthase [Bacteroidota bacterium]
MLEVTKIFRFETAHAIYGYQGPCQNIHGHSYELHVTLASLQSYPEYIPGPGFFIDFKELKKWVKEAIIDPLDHKLILSSDFMKANPGLSELPNIEVWTCEPSAENMLLHFRQLLEKKMPAGVRLSAMRLYETRDSYAEWKQEDPGPAAR